MTVTELLEAGGLAPAIDQLSQALRARPDDSRARTSLFELLLFTGDWTRAERQLEALEHQAASALGQIGTRFHRTLLDAERTRAKLFSDGLRPRFLLEPPASVLLHLDAVNRLREGRPEEARGLLHRAEQERPAHAGTARGKPFDDLRDADDLLAPVLEVFAAGTYAWIPWEQVQYLEINAPRSLRDLVWAPARLASFDGQLGEVHLPNLYPGTASADDDELRLGSRTDWNDTGSGIVRGVGAKLLLVGEDARSLFELGNLKLTPPAALSDADG